MRVYGGVLPLRSRLASVAAASFGCGLALAAVGCAASATPRNIAMAATPRISFARTTTWRSRRVPAPATATDASLTAISCRNTTNCVAGGTAYNATAVGPVAFAATYAHGSWASARILTMPPGTTSSQLNGMSCVAPGPCVAVGTYQTSAGPSFGFIAEQSGA